MATKYRRLTYRDYDGSALVTALDNEIAMAWEFMHEHRRAAKEAFEINTRDWSRDMAWTYQRILKTLLSIRRYARES